MDAARQTRVAKGQNPPNVKDFNLSLPTFFAPCFVSVYFTILTVKPVFYPSHSPTHLNPNLAPDDGTVELCYMDSYGGTVTDTLTPPAFSKKSWDNLNNTGWDD